MIWLVAWTLVQGPWTINLTGNPLWVYSATTSWGGLTPYAYAYATRRFTGNLEWLARTEEDTLEGRWQMGFSPYEVTSLWMRYAGKNLEVRLGDLGSGDWTLPVQTPRARGTVVRMREGNLEGEGLWFFPQGSVQMERIPGNNTQGPFRLEQAPLLPGSEEVYLVQEGNRTQLRRGEDYTVDYWVGEVALLRRVLYAEEYLEIRYVLEGEGTGLRAAGMRFATGPFTAGGGGWQAYGPGGLREVPGGFLELAGEFPFMSGRAWLAGEEQRGVMYGQVTHRMMLGPWESGFSGIWRKDTTALPGEGPLQVRQQLETEQRISFGRVLAGGGYAWEEGLQQVRSTEGWLEGPVLSGTWKVTGTRREVTGTSLRQGLKLEGTYPGFRFFLARYEGHYPARGIQPGAWWESGGDLETSLASVQTGVSLHTEIQGRRHQENFSVYFRIPRNLLRLQVTGRRTFEGLWLATLSGTSRMEAGGGGVELQASRTFQSDQYLLEPSNFWRVSSTMWVAVPVTQVQAGGSIQQGERTMTDTGGVLSRTYELWGALKTRGRWGMLQTVGTWQQYRTVIPVEGETRSRTVEARVGRSWRVWQVEGMVRTVHLLGWSAGGYTGSRKGLRAEGGVIQQEKEFWMGLSGVFSDTVVADMARFSRTYWGIQVPSGTRRNIWEITLRPEVGKGRASLREETGVGWIYRLNLQVAAVGKWGRLWGGVEEEQTTFGLYRLRRVQGGVDFRWGLLRAGGSVLREEDLLRDSENRSLNIHVGGVF